MTTDDDDHARAQASLATLGRDELAALVEALDLRVRGGTATLEDFGALARARQELARRVGEGGPERGR